MVFSIIIVNYNLSKEVINCVNSILAFSTKYDYEIIIVDNRSDEEDINVLLNAFPNHIYRNINIYKLENNKGFGFANNYGASKARGEILILLNPDTVLIEDIFFKIISIFNRDKNIGIVGSKILDAKNNCEKSIGLFPNIFLEFLDIFSLKRKFEYTFLLKKIINGKNEFYNVDWVTAAAMFIPKHLFEEVGGFDEEFFMYNEDIDLCKRIKAKGYKIIYTPYIKIKHFGSVASKKNYFLFTKYSYESKIIYYKKHFSKFNQIILRFILLLHVFFQIIIWLMLYILNKEKSKNKIKAFILIIKQLIIS
ncbi:MAG: glycosyltransferase family 2 protein [Ignavibacteria bacterium]|jgi:GT2 family glycosyltransferase|nr:glycosyltransferase family 2 protein [Ignavibacteria bacterium]MDH7527399.1 glycosyltransferase family 2 protein [Ignavibacteria bacterium]